MKSQMFKIKEKRMWSILPFLIFNKWENDIMKSGKYPDRQLGVLNNENNIQKSYAMAVGEIMASLSRS